MGERTPITETMTQVWVIWGVERTPKEKKKTKRRTKHVCVWVVRGLERSEAVEPKPTV